ncbi:hypothetical protein KP13_04738 [Klebsiella pneumoniae subsp. pneumoniae Kp13]|nr:hypothetical protein KP13_04738 [Klebsiella pneumoniae subsp. pneumoniae Kp13]
MHGRSGEERAGDRMAWLSPRMACSIIPAKLIKKSGKRRAVFHTWKIDDRRIPLG